LTACQAKPAIPLETEEQKEIKRLEADVRSKLKDPESATFRDIFIKGDKGCTNVNAKNGFGGFTGYECLYVSKNNYGEWGVTFTDQRGYNHCIRLLFGK
jgi:hypothetical protein